MSKKGGGGEKKLVTEDELHSLVAGFAEQLAGGAASAWGGKLGQTDAAKRLMAKMGTGLFASAIGTVGLAGIGSVLSNKGVVGKVLEPFGIPDGFVAFFAENVGDVTEGLAAERLRQMSKPEVERALADHATKKIAEMSKKLETNNYDDAYRLLGIGQKRQLDGYLRTMTAAQQKEFEEVYKPKLKTPRDIADALEIGTDVGLFVGYLGRRFPPKPKNEAQAAAVDFFTRVEKGVVGAAEKFFADPSASFQKVADGIKEGNDSLEVRLTAAKNAGAKIRRRPFR